MSPNLIGLGGATPIMEVMWPSEALAATGVGPAAAVSGGAAGLLGMGALGAAVNDALIEERDPDLLAALRANPQAAADPRIRALIRREETRRGRTPMPTIEELVGARPPRDASPVMPAADAFGPATYDPTRVFRENPVAPPDPSSLVNAVRRVRQGTPAAFPGIPSAGMDERDAILNAARVQQAAKLSEAEILERAAKGMPMLDREGRAKNLIESAKREGAAKGLLESDHFNDALLGWGMKLLGSGNIQQSLGEAGSALAGARGKEKDEAALRRKSALEEGMAILKGAEGDTADKRLQHEALTKALAMVPGTSVYEAAAQGQLASKSGDRAHALELQRLKNASDDRRTDAIRDKYPIAKLAGMAAQAGAIQDAIAQGKSVSNADKMTLKLIEAQMKAPKPEVNPLQKATMERWGERIASEGIPTTPADMRNFSIGMTPKGVDKTTHRLVWE